MAGIALTQQGGTAMVRSDGNERRVDTRWFQGLLADKQISQRRLARTIGLDPAAVSLMFNGKRKMSAAEAAAIAKVLGIDVQEVILRAGIHAPMPGRDRVERVVQPKEAPAVVVSPDPDVIEVPVPMADGSVARLLLPKALTRADAERL